MKVSFVVSLDVPEGSSVTDVKDYIEDAVRTWCGSLRSAGGYGEDDPGDPMFYLDKDSVKVRRMR
jgi:hypothetical protein